MTFARTGSASSKAGTGSEAGAAASSQAWASEAGAATEIATAQARGSAWRWPKFFTMPGENASEARAES